MKKIISIPIVKYSLVLIGVFLATMLITSLITGHLKKKNNSLTAKNGLSDKNINTVSNTEISSDILVSDEEEQKELEENAEEIKSDEDKPAHVESDSPYYIRINTSANCVTIYAKGDDGEYSRPVKAMICSTGPYTPPCGKYPKNLYKIPGNRWEWGALQQNVYGHYVTKIVGNILFHSVPYTENYNPGSLEWWEFDKLGTAASAGCIRLQIKDAQWIYSNIPGGTYIEFYQSSNPGPLGRPSASKISGNERCRGWDPTDGNSSNPWLNQPQETPKPAVTPVSEPSTEPKPATSPVNTTTEQGVEEVVTNTNTNTNNESGQNPDSTLDNQTSGNDDSNNELNVQNNENENNENNQANEP